MTPFSSLQLSKPVKSETTAKTLKKVASYNLLPMLPSITLALPNWFDLLVVSSLVLQLLRGVWMCRVSCGWCPSHVGIQVATASILRPQRAAICPKKRLLPPKPTPNSAKLPWSPGIGKQKIPGFPSTFTHFHLDVCFLDFTPNDGSSQSLSCPEFNFCSKTSW